MNMDVDIERLLDEFDDQGFVILEDVVTPDEAAELKAAVADTLAVDWERYQGRPGKEQFIVLDLVHYGGPFTRLLENDNVDRAFSAVLGPAWTLYSFTSTIVQPDDERSERQYTCEVHTDTVRHIPCYRTAALATLALDEFTAANGATYFLPGSHLVEERPSDEEFWAKAVQIERPARSIALFHPRVWHAGGSNTTAETRFGCTLYACRPWMKQRFDFPRMLSDDVLATIGERGRRVLGFDARVPMSMDEFYVPAEQRLYKGGQG